jgi:hypothetical protein
MTYLYVFNVLKIYKFSLKLSLDMAEAPTPAKFVFVLAFPSNDFNF